MTKRNQEIDVDAGAEFEAFSKAAEAIDNLSAVIAAIPPETLAQIRLIDSGIAILNKNEIVWRKGHLEHLARLYVADPALTRRDYLDDLIVAENLDAEKFAALVEQARGE